MVSPTWRRNKIIGQQWLQDTVYLRDKTRHLLCWLINKNTIINCHYDLLVENVNNLKPWIKHFTYLEKYFTYGKPHVEPCTTVYMHPCLSAAIFNYSWPHLQPKPNSTIGNKILKIIPLNNSKMWHNSCPNHLHSINIIFYYLKCLFLIHKGQIQTNVLLTLQFSILIISHLTFYFQYQLHISDIII